MLSCSMKIAISIKNRIKSFEYSDTAKNKKEFTLNSKSIRFPKIDSTLKM